MGTKAADLSQSGITAVWLPPPTQSVAPQGFARTSFSILVLSSYYPTRWEVSHIYNIYSSLLRSRYLKKLINSLSQL